MLGQHRDDAFIPYTSDIDLGILSSDYQPNLKETILEHGKGAWTCTHERGKAENSLEFTFTYSNSVTVDLFLFYPLPDPDESDLYYSAGFLGECDDKVDKFCKFRHHLRGFERVEFFGKWYSVPANTEEFLAEQYGNDWNIPRQFGYLEGLAGAFANKMED